MTAAGVVRTRFNNSALCWLLLQIRRTWSRHRV